MLNPDLKGILNQGISRYSLVTATAKRAREISEDETKNVTKPVIEAIREINDGEVIVTSEN